MRRFQQLFAFFFLAGFLLLAFAPFIFAQQTELQYPEVTGAESPNTTRELPKVIKYLFNLGLAISGFIAFGSFVYGGIKYLFSAGSPPALQDAKDQIFASLLGIVVLFGSYMLLTTINPQLVVLQIPKTGSARGGVILYTQPGCPALDNLKDEEDYIRVKGNLSLLPDTFTKLYNPQGQVTGDRPIKSIRFFSSSQEVTATLYSQIDYKQDLWNSDDNPEGIQSGSCIEGAKLLDRSGGEVKAKSVTLSWKSPGIYLFAGKDCTGETRLFVGNTSSFGDFEDRAKSLMIIPTLEKVPVPGPVLPGQPQPYINQVKSKLGAILYENANFKEDAMVVLGGTDSEKIETDKKKSCVNLYVKNNPLFPKDACPNASGIYCKEPMDENRVSSLRVFQQVIPRLVPIKDPNNPALKDPGGEGVIVWGNYQWNEQAKGDRAGDQQIHCGAINAVNSATTLGAGKPLWVSESSANFNGPPNDKRYAGTDNESNENCKDVFNTPPGPGINKPPSMVSSISVDGSYIGILFNDNGKGEAFLSPGDIRLFDNHIGDDQAKYLLVIPLQPN